MQRKFNDFIERHEGSLIFTCFVASATAGYVLSHITDLISLIH